MGFEGFAHRWPGSMDTLIEESFLDRDQQVVGQDAKEDVRLHALLELMEDRSLGKRRLHIAEGALDIP